MTFLDELTLDDLADEAARLGYTPLQIIAALEARIERDKVYLKRRRLRGTHTPTDEAMSRDLIVLAFVTRLITSAAPPPAKRKHKTTEERFYEAMGLPISQVPPADAPISTTPGEHTKEEESPFP